MSNALDRLVNKKKPSVPPRIDVVEEILPIPSQPKEEIAELTQDAIKNLSQDSKTSLSQDTNTETDLDDFETVRNTIRLDRAIDDSLRQLCQDERITKETLLEAAYLYLDAHPTELEEVVRTARQRLQRRKEIDAGEILKVLMSRYFSVKVF